ncbi:MAG: hypothetical protein A2X40_02945 [Elusimicrobia bacterium GWC2_65_9]|nr:MAG: hypothetical protein A2X40_02945 [Elusimicrobia bacterium GWC2_65_9]OHC66044.1 MAG: hypothetical protein A2040_03615 [Rhodocyclales bacterium GWA2_65_19]
MLGAAVMACLKELGRDAIGVDLIHPDSSLRLDVSDWRAVSSFAPLRECGLLLHLAAATDVDRCENEPDLAFRANALAPQLLSRLCAERDIPMVHVGTAAVFAGNHKTGPYTEYDDPAPMNVYGWSKLRGEQVVRETHRKHFIVRAGWMMGGGAEEKKFVGKIVSQLLEGKRRLMAVSDKRGSPTYTVDFARGLMSLVESGHHGTYHLANHGTCTRDEIARKIAAFMGIDAVVEPVASSCFPLPAHRPDSECLRNYKLELLGLDRMPHWEKSLESCLKTLVPALKR